jgi:hypothetical protein
MEVTKEILWWSVIGIAEKLISPFYCNLYQQEIMQKSDCSFA